MIEVSHLQPVAEPCQGYWASLLLFGIKTWASDGVICKFLLSQLRYSGTHFPLIYLYGDLGSKNK